MLGFYGDDSSVASPAVLDTAASAVSATDVAAVTSAAPLVPLSTAPEVIIGPPTDVHYIGASAFLPTFDRVAVLADTSKQHPAMRNGQRRLPAERDRPVMRRRAGLGIVGTAALLGVGYLVVRGLSKGGAK